MVDRDITQLVKDNIVAVPLLGSALAVTFDVGYFSGIDINLFTLFTISEHLVFTLEALPLGVCIAVGAFIAINYFEHLDKRIERIRDRNVWLTAIVLSLITCLYLVIAYYFNVILISVVGLFAGVISGIWRLRPPNLFSLLFWSGVIVFALAYSFGYETSRIYLSYGDPIQTIETTDGKMSVLLIRSGEKGILFYDPKIKLIGLLRWDAIKRISQSWQP